MAGRWIRGLCALALAPSAWSFCGFYVAQEPGSLFNESSVVVLARDGDHTVLTMANDYQGDPAEFGLVVPVPQIIERRMVGIGDRAAIDALNQYSVPRLALYYDPDPCPPNLFAGGFRQPLPPSRCYQAAIATLPGSNRHVRVEREYEVDEYAITVIAADDGMALQRWLTERGYQVPDGAAEILESYIRQDMHFFLAKIDLSAQAKLGVRWPRPLRVSYDSPKFVLPLRLGTLNARGAQDLTVLALTPSGRVESTNYRTARMTTEQDVPEWLAAPGKFNPFYEAAFERRVERDGLGAVYLEYAWPLAVSCDPCSGAQLRPEQLLALGADWTQANHYGFTSGFLTRLHVRYDRAHFPEDLVFQETADRAPWQVRFVAHVRATGAMECPEAEAYLEQVAAREVAAERSLVGLTGWSAKEVAKRRK